MVDFVYADPHFSHRNIVQFASSSGVALRPWDDVDVMDSDMIRLFNETVTANDKVYFLGDVCINRRGLLLLEQINCRNLVLIKGNHDIFRLAEYTKYFRDIRACQLTDGMLMTHIPVHELQLQVDGRYNINCHGHLHDKQVMKDGEIDPRYICVSVEQTDFKPIAIEEVRAKAIARGGVFSTITYGNGKLSH